MAHNAALAMAAVEALLGGRALSPEVVVDGFAAVQAPARMELVQVACRQISEAVTKRYFEVSDVAEWQGGQA